MNNDVIQKENNLEVVKKKCEGRDRNMPFHVPTDCKGCSEINNCSTISISKLLEEV